MHSAMTTRCRLKWLLLIMAAVLVVGVGLAGCALPAREDGSATAMQAGGNAALLPEATPTFMAFTPEPAHDPGVADLLRNPSPAGQSVEVDAYFDIE